MNPKSRSTPLVYLECNLSEIQFPNHFFRDMNNIQQTGQLTIIEKNRYFWKRRDILMPNKGLLMRFIDARGWREACVSLWFQQDCMLLGLVLKNHQLSLASTLPLPRITFWLNNNQVRNYLLVIPFSCLFTMWKSLAHVICLGAFLEDIFAFWILWLSNNLASCIRKQLMLFLCIHLTNTDLLNTVL